MSAVWYDEDSDRIWIEGAAQSYAPRTLVAVRTGSMIGVRLKERSDNILWQDYGLITDQAGAGFASADAAAAYLSVVFARRPVQGFTFTQSAPSSVWIIVHGLNFRPSVSLIDTAGDSLLADLAWPDAATVLVRFGAPTAGTAYLS